MPHFEAKLTSKGQATVPAPVREFLRLKTGDILDFYIDETNGEVRVRARNMPAAEMFGALNRYAPKSHERQSLEKMQEAVGEYLAEDDRRIRRQRREQQQGKATKPKKPIKAAE